MQRQFIIPRYDWLVDRQSTQASYTCLGDISRGIQVSMELKSTLPAAKVSALAVPAIDMSTVGTFLTGISRINAEDVFTKSFRLIPQKLLELVERPLIQLSIKVASAAFLYADLGQILDGINPKGHLPDGFGETMVHVSHKPFLPSCQAVEFPLRRSGAFRLKLLAEIRIFCSNVLHLLRIKKAIVRTDDKIDNALINAENVALLLGGRFRFNGHMQKERIITIGERATFDVPIAILMIVFWEHKGRFNPAINCSKTSLLAIQPNGQDPLIIPNCGIGFEIGEFLELDTAEGFTRNIPGASSQTSWQVKLVPNWIIRSIMDSPFTTCLMLEPPLSTIVSSMIKLFNCTKKGRIFLKGEIKFKFEGSLHIHIFALIGKKRIMVYPQFLPH